MNIIIEQSKEAALDIQTLKSHLRIEHNHEDAYLDEIIGMATCILEGCIHKPILEKKYKCVFYGGERRPYKVEIPIGCVNKIVSVKEEPDGKELQFFVDTEGERTYVLTEPSKSSVEIVYSAGMTCEASKVPKDIKYAILQISKNIYDCCEQNPLESENVKQIINSYRTILLN
jgi:uncharacterized phiE125 gp8 family phage protein